MLQQQSTERSADDTNTPAKKSYAPPMIVEIGKTADIVQSYYQYNISDGYARYYAYTWG